MPRIRGILPRLASRGTVPLRAAPPRNRAGGRLSNYGVMKRFLDLIALAALGLVVLLPRPGVEVKAAVDKLDPQTEQRIAELQAALLGNADDREATVEVAEIYRSVHRPEWALATLGPLRDKAPDDWRVGFGIAMAHAERFEFESAHGAMRRALTACEAGRGPVACGAAQDARMRLVQAGLRRIVDQHIDPRAHPEVVQEIMYQTIRATKTPPPPRPKR